MHSEVVWVIVSSGTQVQPQIILEPDLLPDYLSVPYDYAHHKDLVSNSAELQFIHKFIFFKD